MSNRIMTTTKPSLALAREYPLLHGSPTQVSSKADETGLHQQFVDRGMVKELGLSRTTVPGPEGGHEFKWELQFYVHPGMRRFVPVKLANAAEIVDRIHALAVGVAPLDALERRINDWCQFHTFGFGGYFQDGSDVLKFLRRQHFDFATVERNIGPYGIEAYAKRADGTFGKV